MLFRDRFLFEETDPIFVDVLPTHNAQTKAQHEKHVIRCVAYRPNDLLCRLLETISSRCASASSERAFAWRLLFYHSFCFWLMISLMLDAAPATGLTRGGPIGVSPVARAATTATRHVRRKTDRGTFIIKDKALPAPVSVVMVGGRFGCYARDDKWTNFEVCSHFRSIVRYAATHHR